MGKAGLLMCCVVAAAACGRIGFAPLAGGVVDAPRDGTGDGVVPAEACPAFAFFCDGFETGDVSRWSGANVGPGGTLMPQTATVHSGSYALFGSMPVGSSVGSTAAVAKSFSQSTGFLAIRMWVYWPQPPTGYDGVLLVLNETAPNHYVLVAGDPTGFWYVGEDSQAGFHEYLSTTAVTVGTWQCVELDYTFVPGAPGIDLYVDDTKVESVTGRDTTPLFDHEDVGVARADASGSTTIVDDVVMAAQHIGCQ
jgi:hypothetical protein